MHSQWWHVFRLGDAAVLKTFDDRVKQQYKVPLKAMVDFVEEFLDVRTSTKRRVPCKGLIELLNADITIDGNRMTFMPVRMVGTMTKDQILSAKSCVCLHFTWLMALCTDRGEG